MEMSKGKSVTLKEIKEEIIKCLTGLGIKVTRIILFGSRARGDSSKSSDYDFLIIIDKTFSIKEKMQISKHLNKVLAKLLIPSDIIINSEQEVEDKKNRIGCVTRYALKEGIKI